MKLYADLSQRVVMNSEDLDWVDSPMIGVQRRMLERDGQEVARATAIPNSNSINRDRKIFPDREL
jgi:anti-sigma factor ChrR (cupin superfamily)